MTVVVTGASRGIGRELLNFLLDKKGIRVIGLSSHPEKLRALQRRRRNFSAVLADFSTDESIRDTVDNIRAITGEVTVLINNAGLLVNKSFASISSSELEASYRINVLAPFMLTQKLLPLMGRKERAHIVNIGSMGGFQGSVKFAGLSAYSSSKGALSVLTECLAEELKNKNVAANCLCLGAVNTEMLKAAFPGYHAPVSPKEMASFVGNFALTGHHHFNGKILPVSVSTP
jgi:3-oxoacyl-[acyl-carrier protein] reductase